MTPDPGHVGADPSNPQSWNAYAYAGNDPINSVDPTGLAASCYVDGFERDCGDALRLVDSGAADFCPDNVCSFSSDGQFYKFFAGAGGASGYVKFQDLAFLSESQGNLFVQRGGEAQQAVSDKPLYCQDKVISAMKKIWQQSSNGTTGVEASFNANGNRSDPYIYYQPFSNQKNYQSIFLQPNTFANFHVHPNEGSWRPSTPENNAVNNGLGDTGLADKAHIQMYIVSAQGLGFYDGNTRNSPVLLRPNLDWKKKC